jgi:hypothetical protein
MSVCCGALELATLQQHFDMQQIQSITVRSDLQSSDSTRWCCVYSTHRWFEVLWQALNLDQRQRSDLHDALCE